MSDFDERAAIVAEGTGAPIEWAEGFAKLDLSVPPANYPAHRWREVVDAAGRFLDSGFAAQAAACGWSTHDVFGVHPVAPAANYSVTGLIPLIAGSGEVEKIDARCAWVRHQSGGVTRYLRRPRPGAVCLWELAR